MRVAHSDLGWRVERIIGDDVIRTNIPTGYYWDGATGLVKGD